MIRTRDLYPGVEKNRAAVPYYRHIPTRVQATGLSPLSPFRPWEFVIMVLEPLFEHFRQKPVSNEEVKIHEDDLRGTVFTRVCLNGYPPCISYTLGLLKTLQLSCASAMLSNRSCNVIPPYLRQPIYATAVMYGDDDVFEFMHSKWEMEVYMTEKERIWIALGASKKKEHIHRIFNNIFFSKIPMDLRPMCAGYVRYLFHCWFSYKSFTHSSSKQC
ncbi:unnamed protein product [Nippostrongylus brasiliensis]|uniref:ERAP1_C domain-containing protein n=1 Tax=Nippostrongylus brasiliensis TaxID=27835 RepID=A0A0N4YRU0_NIPBR|nr:unnamed protein product [Nippostrongylus brasiliensis]